MTLREVAEAYTGHPLSPDASTIPLEESKRVARAYHEAKHDPRDPEVAASYGALKRETVAQYNHLLSHGYKIDRGGYDITYPTSAALHHDVNANRHLEINPTKPGSLPADHPMAEVEPTTGHPYNDLFRVVHDIFGHALHGHTFGRVGEFRAFQDHAKMYSPAAHLALVAETHGQNSWLNAHEGNDRRPMPERIYPEQKAAKVKLARVEGGPLNPTELARSYMHSVGRKYDPSPSALTVPDDFSSKVARWYAGAKDQTGNPAVEASYKAYAHESLAQLQHLLANGLKITPMKSLAELYPSSKHMQADLKDHGHLKYLPTALGWDGDASHPMAKETGLRTEDGTPILYNDAFRIIHDVFGHATHGHQFGPKGEARAWHQHARMYSKEARPAMTYETFGQTRDYFFGKQKHLPVTERDFPKQKAAMMPRALTPKVKLARTQAPAGGGIVNNSFKGGGQFMDAPLLPVRLVCRAIRRKLVGPVRLARVEGDPTFAGLVAAIHANPHDSLGYGALADHLEESGHDREAHAIRFVLRHGGVDRAEDGLGIAADPYKDDDEPMTFSPLAPGVHIRPSGVHVVASNPANGNRPFHVHLAHADPTDALLATYHAHRHVGPVSRATAAKNGVADKWDARHAALRELAYHLKTFGDPAKGAALERLLGKRGKHQTVPERFDYPRGTEDQRRTMNTVMGSDRTLISHAQKPGSPVRLQRT